MVPNTMFGWIKVKKCTLSVYQAPFFGLKMVNCFAIKQCWGSLWLPLVHSDSLWLALRLSLAPTGSLRLSQALYCLPNLLTKSLLGSQGPCSARSSATGLHDFLQVCDALASLESTPVSPLVSWLVGPSHFQMFTLSASLDRHRASAETCEKECHLPKRSTVGFG